MATLLGSFQNSIDSDFNFSFFVEGADGCTPFDFTGYVFSGVMYDFFNKVILAPVIVTNILNEIVVQIAADSVIYAPAIYTVKINGSEGFSIINLAVLKIAYFKV